jgi:hypothetical protein
MACLTETSGGGPRQPTWICRRFGFAADLDFQLIRLSANLTLSKLTFSKVRSDPGAAHAAPSPRLNGDCVPCGARLSSMGWLNARSLERASEAGEPGGAVAPKGL